MVEYLECPLGRESVLTLMGNLHGLKADDSKEGAIRQLMLYSVHNYVGTHANENIAL